MRRLLLAVATAVPPGLSGVCAQEANRNEAQTVTEIAQCMAKGLPEDWVSAHMTVELAGPGRNTGGVRYLVARRAAGELEPFTPCDTDRPASLLVELQALQPPQRRGWTAARLVIERDGSFRLNYDYPR